MVAGLLIGNRGRALAMSAKTRESLDTFWMVVDEALNAMLFVLIGFEILAIELRWEFLAAGAAAIPVVLLSRLLSVSIPIAGARLRRRVKPYTIRLLTWGGLRGGIAIALALSIPPTPARDLVLTLTYVVVVFSILVQGLSVEPLARRGTPTEEDVRPHRPRRAEIVSGAGARGPSGMRGARRSGP